MTKKLVSLMLMTFSATALAGTYEECLVDEIVKADSTTSILDIEEICKEKPQTGVPVLDPRVRECLLKGALAPDDLLTVGSLLENCQRLALHEPEVPTRLVQEKMVEDNPYVLSAHKRNYLLPATYMDSPNQEPYSSSGLYPGIVDPIRHVEVKLQVSLKVPLTYSEIVMPNDSIYFGFTMKSFWQLYSDEISAPFRETNYNPEFFYEVPLGIEALNGTILTRVGLEHESNGRSQLLSRSWNRAYLLLGYGQSNWGVAIRPWYRLPEDLKDDDGDPSTPPPAKGDDNPDIEDYMGHYELIGSYKMDSVQFGTMLRQNFDTGKGAIELGMSFPLWGRLNGYVELFSGYGESLIDYDHRVNRIGVGILLTDLL